MAEIVAKYGSKEKELSARLLKKYGRPLPQSVPAEELRQVLARFGMEDQGSEGRASRESSGTSEHRLYTWYSCMRVFVGFYVLPMDANNNTRDEGNQNQLLLLVRGKHRGYVGGYTVLGSIVGSEYYALLRDCDFANPFGTHV